MLILGPSVVAMVSAMNGFCDRCSQFGLIVGKAGHLAGVAYELAGAIFPRVFECKFTAGLTRRLQGFQASRPQILVQCADWVIGDDILWASDRISRDWNAACQRFKLHDAECVSGARKEKHAGRGEVRGQNAVVQVTEKLRVGKPALQLFFLRPLADDNLSARQIERQKCVYVLLDRDAAERHENWPGKIEV